MSRKPKVVLILQARMGSTRLPGKSLLDLSGQPLIMRIVDRVRRCQLLDGLVVAIPSGHLDDSLNDVLNGFGVNVFRGDEENVLARFVGATKKFSADLVLRLPADNPIPDPKQIDRLIEFHLTLKDPGFSSNLAPVLGSGYPDGIGAEAFGADKLIQAYEKTHTIHQSEHIHLNFFDYKTQKAVDKVWCPVNAPKCPSKIRRPDLVFDINTSCDYAVFKEMYRDLLNKSQHFSTLDAIKWMDNYKAKFVP